jgi:hypothetical protein
MRRLAYIASAVLGVILGLSAQEAPHLKPDVALTIRTLQLQRSENQTRMLVLQQQYMDAQATVKDLDGKIAAKVATALKESDIDPDKYNVDAQTLNVTPRPASHPPPPPGPPQAGGSK